MNRIIFEDYIKGDEKALEVGDIIWFPENQESNSFIIVKDSDNRLRLLNSRTLFLDERIFKTFDELNYYLKTNKFDGNNLGASKNFEWTIYFP